MKSRPAVRQAPGDERRPGGDEAKAPVTSGVFRGISGEQRQAVALYWVIGLAIAGSICVFDILTRRHDRPDQNPLDPVISEGSSLFVTAIILALPAAVALWMKRRAPPWWWAALVHGMAVVVYSVLHVSGFVLLRKLAFPLLVGAPYRFGPLPSEFVYEFGKDAVTYAMAFGGCLLLLNWRSTPPSAASDTPEPQWFDIRDGARLIRAAIPDILAVRSAGNYSEFILSDGRRPLMRTGLGALQADLVSRGFVRTHRSWLVNSARITGLRPAGSGDYVVELGVLEAPLSRRFRDALASLRVSPV